MIDELSKRDKKLYDAFKNRTEETDKIVNEFIELQQEFESYQDKVQAKLLVTRMIWLVIGFIIGIGYTILL